MLEIYRQPIDRRVMFYAIYGGSRIGILLYLTKLVGYMCIKHRLFRSLNIFYSVILKYSLKDILLKEKVIFSIIKTNPHNIHLIKLIRLVNVFSPVVSL